MMKVQEQDPVAMCGRLTAIHSIRWPGFAHITHVHAVQSHPQDKNTDDPNAVHEFQQIGLAYRVLSDPEKRRWAQGGIEASEVRYWGHHQAQQMA